MTKFMKTRKLAIIQGYNPDLLSQTEYANEMDVNKSQFQYWLKLYEMHGESAFTNGIRQALNWTYLIIWLNHKLLS
jgi:transposase